MQGPNPPNSKLQTPNSANLSGCPSGAPPAICARICRPLPSPNGSAARERAARTRLDEIGPHERAPCCADRADSPARSARRAIDMLPQKLPQKRPRLIFKPIFCDFPPRPRQARKHLTSGPVCACEGLFQPARTRPAEPIGWRGWRWEACLRDVASGARARSASATRASSTATPRSRIVRIQMANRSLTVSAARAWRTGKRQTVVEKQHFGRN
jgi:hypothetical protein